jgi:hypothetical protein
MPFAQPWDLSRRTTTGAAATVAGMIPMLALASPASAHNVCAYHPSDPSTVCLSAGGDPYVEHRYLVVCDRARDGHKANAKAWRNGVVHRLYDQNGGQPGCTAHNANVSNLDRFAICVESEHCGPPVWKDQF